MLNKVCNQKIVLLLNACKCDNTNASLIQDGDPICFTSASQGGLTFTSFSVTVKLIPSETVARLSAALPSVTDLITVIVWTRIGRWKKKIPGKVKISCHVGEAHSLKAEGRRRGLKLTGTLRNYDDDDNDNAKQKKQQLILWAKQQLCRSTDVHCTTTMWNVPKRRFMEDVDIRQQIFLSLFEHG